MLPCVFDQFQWIFSLSRMFVSHEFCFLCIAIINAFRQNEFVFLCNLYCKSAHCLLYYFYSLSIADILYSRLCHMFPSLFPLFSHYFPVVLPLYTNLRLCLCATSHIRFTKSYKIGGYLCPGCLNILTARFSATTPATRTRNPFVFTCTRTISWSCFISFPAMWTTL